MSASAVVSKVSRELLIGDSWKPGRSGATLAVEDPATGQLIAEVADADGQDALAALDAASGAQVAWGASPPSERSELLRRAYEAMMSRREELATIITLEMGKPIGEARQEVDYAADFFRWFAGEALRIEGDFRVSPSGAGRILVLRQAVGPCLMVTPWNFPLAMGARKIAPALAAGCTTVMKPAPQTPLSALFLAELLLDVGAPAGVVNVITSSNAAEVVGPLLADPRLRKLSFTGSTQVGRTLFSQSSRQMLRLSLELGGNAPFLVFEDADVEKAVDAAVLAKMRNGGEACVAANRFLVAEELEKGFSSELAGRLAALRMGPGLDERTEVGPLIDAGAVDKVSGLVAEACSRGAAVQVGGGPRHGDGYFFEPTVLRDVPSDATLLHQEIFGPVAPVTPFGSEAEAIAKANSTEHGLVAYVFTRDVHRALRTCEALEVGMVGLNQGMVSNAAAPFGGIKQSGVGREGGREGIGEYLETKYIAVNTGD